MASYVDELYARYGVPAAKSPSGGGTAVDQLSAQYGLTTSTPKYGLVSDVKRGFGQMVSGIGSTMQDIGMPDVGRAVEDYGTDITRRNPSQINTFSDVLDKPFTTAREAIGEVVPQAGTAFAGGLGGRLVGGALGGALGSVVPVVGTAAGVSAGQWLGGLAGSLLPIAGQTYGGIRAEQREQGIDDKERAALVTIPAAALERLGVEQLAAKVGTKGLKSLATKELRPGESAWGYAGRQAMKTGLVEGPFTEVPQTALERYGAYQDLTSEEALNAYGVAGAKGYVGGAAVGGAMAPFSLLPESNPTPPPTSETPPVQPRQPLGLPFYANEPMVVFPDGTTMTAAEARQRQADGFTGPPTTQAPVVQTTEPVSEKTPFFEPPLVSTIPGASTLPVLGPQPQIITGENPNAQLILPPRADPVQEWQAVFTKAQRGEMLTQVEREILNNPPQGIQLPQAAPQGPTVRREPTQGELFNDTPLRSAYDVATRGMPPVAPQGPVLNNQQAPGQAELFFPNGQPTYAATQGVPDVARAAAETSRAAGIPASRPGSKTGTKRQQLLERIEKARMEGRFVGREEQYDDLVNDLAQNAFGRVEKGVAEVEKAPLQPAPQAGASPLAAPGTRTLQEVDAEMDAMRVNGRAPQGGVAREAWNDLQRERDALAAQVGAPPRPKYVPPQKAAPKKEEPKKEPPKKEPLKKEPPKKEAPKKPEAKKEAPKKEEPKKEAPAPLKETPQQAFDAMEDRIAYKDLTPEAKGLVDGAHKEGRLSQERIDFIIRQDREAKNAAKRAANKPKPEDDLEDDTPPQPKKKAKLDKVPPAVLAKTEVEIDALNPDTGKFEKTKVSADEAVKSLEEDKDTFQNFVNCLKKGK